MYENVILTDYDGVCAKWDHSFALWMISNGYNKPIEHEYDIHKKYNISESEAHFCAKMFNESFMLSKLPPYKDAIKYIRKLHEEEGYVFHCITAIPNIRSSFEARMINIENLFGKTAFEKVVLTDVSENKFNVLKEYKDSQCYWLEDHPKNAEYGLMLGLRPILFKHSYNSDYTSSKIPRVNSWKEVYNIVIGEEEYLTW